MFLILEWALEFHYPHVLGFDQNLPLRFDMPDLVLVEHFLLLHLLHSNDVSRLFELADADLSKGTSAYDAQWVKVLQCNLLSPKRTKLTLLKSYILRLSSASLWRMSCLISSYSASLKFIFSIFLTSISHAKQKTTSDSKQHLPSFLSCSSSLSF